MDLKYEGGETSAEAMNRIVEVVNEAISSHAENTIIVAHGGIISLLLKHYDQNFGFEQWRALSNPDVYLLHVSNSDVQLNRIWKD